MTEPTVERMEDGLFARFGALTYTAPTSTLGRWRVTAPGLETYGSETREGAIGQAWRAEVDRLHKALADLGAPVVVDSPSDTPAGPVPAQERPTAWNPMATCPRDRSGVLTEEVWLNARGYTPMKFPRGATLTPAVDTSLGRRGWLPGHLAEADLPPVEVTP